MNSLKYFLICFLFAVNVNVAQEDNQDKLKGEFTIILDGKRQSDIDFHMIDKILDLLEPEMTSKSAIKICSIITGYKKSIVYKHSLERKR